MNKILLTAVSAAVLMMAAAAPARAQSCAPVSGKFNELILPQSAAPNDPAGRVLGNVDGTLAGATTAFITSLTPSASGFRVTTNNAFATLEGNLLFATGSGTWANIRPNFYQAELTLTVTGGTGKYAGATGTIQMLGVGNSVGPGTGQFLHEYRGSVCTK